MDKSKTKKKPRAPPMVAEIPHKVHEMDGVEVIDNFFWLREKDNPKVLKFLEDENAYLCKKQAILCRVLHIHGIDDATFVDHFTNLQITYSLQQNN
jgi:oligopeptidase B